MTSDPHLVLGLHATVRGRLILLGHTDNLDARIGQHAMGTVPGYTSTRRPVTLVYSDELPTRDDAFAMERKIKGWSRVKKEAFIREDWAAISVLARKKFRRPPFDTRPSAS